MQRDSTQVGRFLDGRTVAQIDAAAARTGGPSWHSRDKTNCSSLGTGAVNTFAWVGGATRSEASLNKGCSPRFWLAEAGSTAADGQQWAQLLLKLWLPTAA